MPIVNFNETYVSIYRKEADLDAAIKVAKILTIFTTN